MNRVRLVALGLAGVVAGISPLRAADDVERRFREVVQDYQRDEARLPRLIHYQQATGGVEGGSRRREAWVSLDGALVKAVEERLAPKGSELIEMSLDGDSPYFVFRQKKALLGDGGLRVEEERIYRYGGEIVRWARRSATFPPGAEIDLRAVKQVQLPLKNLTPDDLRTDRPVEAAQAILEALRAAGKPDYDPTAKAGPDWQRVKLVKGTVSPNGRYQLAWAPDAKEIDWSKYKVEGDDFIADPDAGAENFIFDLEKMRLAGETLGRHSGTRAKFDHHAMTMAWSPDSQVFVELNNEKWTYSGGCAGRIVNGRVVSGVHLGKILEKEAGKFLTAKKNRSWLKNQERFGIKLLDPQVSNDGTLAITVFGEVPKSMEPDASVEVRVRVRLEADGVTVKPLGAAYPSRK